MVESTQSSGADRGVSSDVLKVIIEAYYPDIIRAGSAARSRAQAAQSISTLVIGGLVGAISFSSLSEVHTFVRVAAIGTAIAWALTAVLSMRAVAAPAEVDEALQGINSDDGVVREILNRAKAERQAVDRRQGVANTAFIVALAATVLTGLIAAFVPAPRDWSAATFSLKDSETKAISQICPSLAQPFRGKLDTTTLGKSALRFQIECGRTTKEIEVRPDSVTLLVASND